MPWFMGNILWISCDLLRLSSSWDAVMAPQQPQEGAPKGQWGTFTWRPGLTAPGKLQEATKKKEMNKICQPRYCKSRFGQVPDQHFWAAPAEPRLHPHSFGLMNPISYGNLKTSSEMS